MTESSTYGRPEYPGELQRLADVIGESFGFPPANATPWFNYAGHENLRVFRQDGELVGGFLLVPMAQFWGGRPVRMCGFAGVAVAPHVRGRGAATRMMSEGLRELRAQGYPLAGLYPATQPLYRRVGFEQAGARYELRGPIDQLPMFDRTLPMRPLTSADLPRVKALYSELARGRPGWLDRGPYVWHRVQLPRGQTAHGYVTGAPGEVDGYVFLVRIARPNQRFDVMVSDMGARTPEAWRRLITFVRDHDSLAEEVIFFGGADDPRVLLLEEQRLHARALELWMTRVLNVEKALVDRGYPRGLTSSLELELTDALLPENSGRYVLEVSGGEGRVSRGGAGALQCDERALVSIYSGFRSATALSELGLIQTSPEAAERADEIFRSGAPSMPDMF